jgi:hypothetical protein
LEKENLDWDQRWWKLQQLVDHSKNVSKGPYDCVVPIRGTPEYFYVLDIVVNKLGLRPLAVSFNSHFNSRVGIMNIDRIREAFDVDFHTYAVGSTTYKKLVRETLYRHSNMRLPFIAGEKTFPLRIATSLRIPLVIWPYHQPTEQVGFHSYTEQPEMSRRDWEEFDLKGLSIDRLLSPETLLSRKDVSDLEYPDQAVLLSRATRGIYLSNFLPWDSRSFSEKMVRGYGALAAENWRTFDTYDRIDDSTYMSIHDVLKEAALGYSRVTDSLSREIRFGRVTKSVALEVEAYCRSEWPREGIETFRNWLGVGKSGFDWLISHLGAGPKVNSSVSLSVNATDFVRGFMANGPSPKTQDGYILYGKGIPHEEV